MRLLIAYGSLGKYFHLKDFADELKKQNVDVRLVKDIDYSRGFPSKNISDWISGDKKFTSNNIIGSSFNKFYFIV